MCVCVCVCVYVCVCACVYGITHMKNIHSKIYEQSSFLTKHCSSIINLKS